MKKALIACTVISIALVSFDCTSVRRRFIVEGYTKNPGQMIKRIVIISELSPQNKDLAGLISAMTRDLIKTNRNYLVYPASSWAAPSQAPRHRAPPAATRPRNPRPGAAPPSSP